MAINRYILIAVSLSTLCVMANALKCYQCGQYNDGVGSITPCLNYTEQSAPLHLKACPRSSDVHCIVSVFILCTMKFHEFLLDLFHHKLNWTDAPSCIRIRTCTDEIILICGTAGDAFAADIFAHWHFQYLLSGAKIIFVPKLFALFQWFNFNICAAHSNSP